MIKLQIDSESKKKALIIQGLSNLLDKKVMILDLDHPSRQLEYGLGVEDLIVYDILDLLSGTCDLEKAKIGVNERVDLLASSIKPEKYDSDLQDYKDLLEDLESQGYDYVIFTKNPGLVMDERLAWGDIESYSTEKIYQIVDNKRSSDATFIGRLTYKDRYDLMIDSYSDTVDDDLKEVLDNYINKKEAKLSLLDRIFRR
ncbi:MAG: cell division inhibitor [Finegoldia sp.]|nr:cell division inhibitor [Finegoldia sp.]